MKQLNSNIQLMTISWHFEPLQCKKSLFEAWQRESSLPNIQPNIPLKYSRKSRGGGEEGTFHKDGAEAKEALTSVKPKPKEGFE